MRNPHPRSLLYTLTQSTPSLQNYRSDVNHNWMVLLVCGIVQKVYVWLTAFCLQDSSVLFHILIYHHCISFHCICKPYISKTSTYSNVDERLYCFKLLAIIKLLWTFFTCFMEHVYAHYHWSSEVKLLDHWGWVFSPSEDIAEPFSKVIYRFHFYQQCIKVTT